MKVVDEKGKLFGKLNIIDLLVLIFVVAAIVVFGVKSLGGSTNDDTGDPPALGEAKLTYTVRVPAQRPEMAAQMSEYIDITTGKRDQLVANNALVENAYIVDFWSEDSRYNPLTDGSMEFYDVEAGENQGLVDLCFVIEVEVENTLTNTVGSQEVRIGRSHIVKTIHMEFTGSIEKCTWNPVE